jgi:hypothetical protein
VKQLASMRFFILRHLKGYEKRVDSLVFREVMGTFKMTEDKTANRYFVEWSDGKKQHSFEFKRDEFQFYRRNDLEGSAGTTPADPTLQEMKALAKEFAERVFAEHIISDRVYRPPQVSKLNYLSIALLTLVFAVGFAVFRQDIFVPLGLGLIALGLVESQTSFWKLLSPAIAFAIGINGFPMVGLLTIFGLGVFNFFDPNFNYRKIRVGTCFVFFVLALILLSPKISLMSLTFFPFIMALGLAFASLSLNMANGIHNSNFFLVLPFVIVGAVLDGAPMFAIVLTLYSMIDLFVRRSVFQNQLKKANA